MECEMGQTMSLFWHREKHHTKKSRKTTADPQTNQMFDVALGATGHMAPDFSQWCQTSNFTAAGKGSENSRISVSVSVTFPLCWVMPRSQEMHCKPATVQGMVRERKKWKKVKRSSGHARNNLWNKENTPQKMQIWNPIVTETQLDPVSRGRALDTSLNNPLIPRVPLNHAVPVQVACSIFFLRVKNSATNVSWLCSAVWSKLASRRTNE